MLSVVGLGPTGIEYPRPCGGSRRKLGSSGAGTPSSGVFEDNGVHVTGLLDPTEICLVHGSAAGIDGDAAG